jgi:trehalose synthase
VVTDDGPVIEPTLVDVPRRPVAHLASVIGVERLEGLLTAAAGFRMRAADRIVWNVNSTAVGGGVAEMLQVLCGYVQDLGIDIRWLTIRGDADFFAVTKRLHNRIHGQIDAGDLGPAEAQRYEATLAANATGLLDRIRPGDFVLLHDPQTAGLAPALLEHGAVVVWRCHIGADRQNETTDGAWEFLRPYLQPVHGYVFSRPTYPPPWVPHRSTWIIPPSIDPFSAKNQPMAPDTVRAILRRIGALDGVPEPGARPAFTRRDGAPDEVVRAADVVADALPGPADRYVLQVSRWDRLKDMAGVMRAFAEHVAPAGPGYLVLTGPAVDGVGDDPEGSVVYGECVDQWRRLPPEVRRRVVLVTLPVDDVDENAAMVNALQRQSAVIAQKSLAEGFGLTVAEGMWKSRPTVGSAVGGIQDQIVDGTGILIPDPTDLATFGAAVRMLLDQPEVAARMGTAAQAYVAANFVGDRHLLRYAELFEAVIP